MNIDELEKRLLEKEQELWADMSRTEAEGRALGGPEAQNGADSAEIKETVFQETTADWRLYTQVRAALERVKEGTYGRCLDCGHPIEDERLESVPWTPYCLRHQELHDRQPLA
jgi:DnaK suppressor protein